MITIYKYKITPNCEIELPHLAKLLTVQSQGNNPFIWVLLDTEDKVLDKYKFWTIGTGWDAESILEKEYLGTFQLSNPVLVFHVFYEIL